MLSKRFEVTVDDLFGDDDSYYSPQFLFLLSPLWVCIETQDFLFYGRRGYSSLLIDTLIPASWQMAAKITPLLPYLFDALNKFSEERYPECLLGLDKLPNLTLKSHLHV